MKFGVRECVNVVLKAKARTKIGNQLFEKDEPVIYFDSLKTSTLEGATTTVYASGGAGNSRLISWSGEKTLTFTMEDSLMSPMGFAILAGAGLIKAGGENDEHLHIHQTLQTFADVTDTYISVDATDVLTIGHTPAGKPIFETVCTGVEGSIYGLLLNSTGDIIGRLKKGMFFDGSGTPVAPGDDVFGITPDGKLRFLFPNSEDLNLEPGSSVLVLVDYYVVKKSGAYQIDIAPDKFAGSFYLEGSTLFRRQSDGVDLPAELVIPNIRIQSNFSFAMSSSGDPSTFTFTADAFPDYTKWNKKNKVLCSLQVVDVTATTEDESDDYGKQFIDGDVTLASGSGHEDVGDDKAGY